MTPDDRAVQAAQALVDALKDGGRLAPDVAAAVTALLPKRKRGGQTGVKRAGSRQSRGEEIAAAYAFETARGARGGQALEAVRELLQLSAADSTMHAAMKPHLPAARESMAALISSEEALLASVGATDRDYAAEMTAAHERVHRLPPSTQRLLYDALTAWREHSRAAGDHMVAPSDRTRCALAKARESVEQAIGELEAALKKGAS